MNNSLMKYYENRFKVFSEVGWKELLEDINNMKEVIQNLQNCKNGDDLLFKKGQLDILQWILTIQEVSEQAYNELLEKE